MFCFLFFCFFFFSSRRRHTRCSRDWSSDVCSSDLILNSSPLGTRASAVMGLIAEFTIAFDQITPSIFLLARVLNPALRKTFLITRSEERRVGKECRYRRWLYVEKE